MIASYLYSFSKKKPVFTVFRSALELCSQNDQINKNLLTTVT